MVSAANYLEQLKPLTNGELALQTNSLFRDERLGSARVIAHLAEIARRKAYLPLGFTGLFDYCVKNLGVSEGGAWARGQVARAALRVPALLEAIAAGKISLTAAGKLAKHLTLDNFREVLDDCAGITRLPAMALTTSRTCAPTVVHTTSSGPSSTLVVSSFSVRSRDGRRRTTWSVRRARCMGVCRAPLSVFCAWKSRRVGVVVRALLFG